MTVRRVDPSSLAAAHQGGGGRRPSQPFGPGGLAVREIEERISTARSRSRSESVMTSSAVAQKGKSTGWHTDYAAAKAEAKRTGKPLFVTFRCEP